MKKRKLLVILLAAIMATASSLSLCACNTSTGDNSGNTGNTTDTGSTGNTGNTGDNGDTGDKTDDNGDKTDDTGDNDDKTGDTGDTGDDDDTDDLSTVFAKYTDISKWNFAVTYQEVDGGFVEYEDYYEYYGLNIKYNYDRYDDYDKYLGEATDYLGYDDTQDAYYLYWDNLDNTYSKYKENTTEFYNCYYMSDIDVTSLGDYTFNQTTSGYEAAKPNDVGNVVIGQFTGYTWTKFTIQISNGYISQIDGTMNDGYVIRLVFSKYCSINFTLPDAGSSSTTTPTEPTGTMEKQTYNAATFDNERLQDKLTKTGKYPDPAIGLPSTGEYSALVIPVKFSDTTIDTDDLSDLNIAFNGDHGSTGWESVSSYYYKASYEQLNLSFDIAGYNIDGVDYYKSDNTSSYYAGLKETDEDSGEEYNTGHNVLLHEALSYYESRIDLTKYDHNDDGAIDAVYLIYSADVDYESDNSFYWAYVTWDDDDGETKYDGMDVYYYLFAGIGFMKESVSGGYTNEYYPAIPGLTVNASTYIHETGHLLGLDDYYDYEENEGCNEGLGGADMMDATVGDQNVYSKTMLGWLTPQIVTSTQTITISSSQAKGDAILIPLDFNNSYFCEYLLIDLYSAQGLNELHASMDGSYLYDGADCGVRIYHVSSWVENAYDNDYGSFTDNNNSTSNIALIKLIEADGKTKFSDSEGYASESDLWQAGDELSEVFPKYTTNAGKLLIFDIAIVSVSATEATITITFNA